MKNDQNIESHPIMELIFGNYNYFFYFCKKLAKHWGFVSPLLFIFGLFGANICCYSNIFQLKFLKYDMFLISKKF